MKELVFSITSKHRGYRLDQYLSDVIPSLLGQPLSKSTIRKLIVAGAVYLNKNRIRIASKELIEGAVVRVFIDLNKLPAPRVSFVLSEKEILFEDEYLIAVNKPAFLPTQPTLDNARENLYEATKKFLSKRLTSQSQSREVYLGLHHRLDRDTSGVVLFTKAKEANKGVSDAFQQHSIQKVYQALVFCLRENQPSPVWVVNNYLDWSKKEKKQQKTNSGGSFAKTHFEVLRKVREEAGGWILLLKAMPVTGRMHQIRVHLEQSKTPILGDPLYGGLKQLGSLLFPRMLLHAHQLTLKHPISQKNITVESQLPEIFNQCVY